MDIIDFPTNRKLNRRVHPIQAIIIHTTGETDLDKILSFYKSADGFQPHYLIETIGSVRQCAADDLVAYHCAHKAAEQAAYVKGFAFWSTQRWTKNNTVESYGKFFPGYTGWNNRWRSAGLSSPLDLITGAHPNLNSIGIELQQPEDPGADIFTDEQYGALVELLKILSKRYRIPLDKQHVLGHYDVGPMRRTTEKSLYGWDPGGNFNWARLFSATFAAGA